jgi:hypothetical protein
MKRNIRSKTRGPHKLTVRSETLKQLTIEQLEGIAAAEGPTEGLSRVFASCNTSVKNC